MSNIAVITTFPNASWDIYSKQMLQSFVQYWPKDVTIFLQLDDDLLVPQVQQILNREGDMIACGWLPEHAAFVQRNKGRDDPQNYRKQAVRFCHKVFAIKRVLDAINMAKANKEPVERYIVWLDADVHTTRPVTHDDLKQCLPKEGDAVAYMGRKDWDHSECGWLAFDLQNGGSELISEWVKFYLNDDVFKQEQWHDSWLFDLIKPRDTTLATNLTPNAIGMDVWPQSPMGQWSVHYKGPEAKARLAGQQMPQQRMQGMGHTNVIIQTRNAIPDEEIRAHIEKNQSLITKWIQPCTPTDEQLVVVSGGPMLVPEDVRDDIAAGKKIVAVKNALTPLKKAGIKPWACILLDPRPHVADFVKDADPDTLWFVASQVDPSVTLELLARGCTIWGYHAAVNAGEELLTAKQPYAIVSGGSATATRGLYVLHTLGFSNFKLLGYDLCTPDKVDMDAFDQYGQPKYMEYSVDFKDPMHHSKRHFWTEPQLVAQFQELIGIVQMDKWKLEAHGWGMVPFFINNVKLANLRRKELLAKMNVTRMPYEQLLKWNNSKKTKSSMPLLPRLLQILRKRTQANSF